MAVFQKPLSSTTAPAVHYTIARTLQETELEKETINLLSQRETHPDVSTYLRLNINEGIVRKGFISNAVKSSICQNLWLSSRWKAKETPKITQDSEKERKRDLPKG